MNEIMTYAEIKEKYPQEWVLLEDPVTDAMVQVQSGKLLWHSKDRDEVWGKAFALGPRSCAVLFTGPLRRDIGYML